MHNYNNPNIPSNKRNSEHLVDNMKQLYETYPQIETFNINDPFYNDVCFLFTSDVGTDMNLDDRIQEYYVNYYLCEDNCTLTKVIDRDSNPRSVCLCEDKTHITFNEISGKENYESHSVLTGKSIKCIKQSFNIYIGKNPIFWIFMIILIYQIYFLIMYLKYQTKTIQNILHIKDNTSVRSNHSNSISSNVFSKINIDENTIKNNNKESSENSMTEKVKSSGKSEKFSAPVKIYNPPKKESKNNTSSKDNINTNDKDLISKSESTILRDNNNKNMEGSEVSYSEIKYGYETIEINNLVEKNQIMENNFLNDPLTKEHNRKMKIIKKRMNPLKENETKKYLETFEDILYSNENKTKFKNKKNKNIANNLDGNDIINQNLIDNVSENENNPRFPQNKFDPNATSEKNRTIGEDQIIFPSNIDNNNNDIDKNIFIKEEINYENKSKLDKNKKFIDNLFENKKNNTLAKSLKDINNSKNEKDKRIKTDEELDNNKKIKNELIKIGKAQKIRPNSGINKLQKQKHKKYYENKNDYYENKKDYKNYINNNNIIDNSSNSNNNKIN